MKVAFNMNCVSTHQLPLAREVAALVGADDFSYVYEGESGQAYQRATVDSKVFKNVRIDSEEGQAQVENADIVLSGLRDIDLFERRAAKGLKTFYTSERWFKPIPLSGMKLEKLVGVGDWNLPGILRMLIPSYRRMVKRFVKWANTDPNARVLAIGPWAKKDFLQMGVRAEKIVDWGYFVAPSCFETQVPSGHAKVGRDLNANLKVLWVGRELAWKRAGDIEKAVALANKNLATTLRLQLPTSTNSHPITFTKLTGVTPAEVRKAMREHDVYVLASNAEEGWGAALNEALEEGMSAIGTYEAGASAAMLPEDRLYHAGDVKALARLLEEEYRGTLPPCSIGEWTAKSAAKRLLNIAG